MTTKLTRLMAASRKRGSIMITTTMCMFFVFTMAAAILSYTATGLRITRRVQRDAVAFNLAESGAEQALRWLKDQASPPSGTASFDPLNGTKTMPGGTYSVLVTPDPANASNVLKKYTIVGTGWDADMFEKVELVVRQSSFGKYAYFTDQEVSSVSNSRIKFIGTDRIHGPVHSNSANGSDFQIDYTAVGTGPIFDDIVTTASDNIDYVPGDPTSETTFAKIFKGGSRGYELGVDYVPMPTTTSSQQAAAWNSGSAYPSGSTGVYINAGGGIYVQGDASVTAQVDGAGNQQFVIVQGSTTSTITFNYAANKTTKVVSPGGATTNVTGLGTGVLFVNGDITSLAGTIADNRVSGSTVTYRNSYTISTDSASDIYLTNTLKTKSPFDPTQSLTTAGNLKPGTLGLVSRNITVKTGAPANMEIDAMVLAGSSTSNGSFGVQDYNSKTPTGTLRVVGGVIQRARGPVGTANGSGTLQTGYSKDYWYDQRMADNPPPFFPTTGGYDRLSWRRLVG